MRIDFHQFDALAITHLNGGTGTVTAKAQFLPTGKIMCSRIPVGASIGLHRHETGNETNYVLSGTGIAICDGAEEPLCTGIAHYCAAGSSHSIFNTGGEDLVLFTAVVNG